MRGVGSSDELLELRRLAPVPPFDLRCLRRAADELDDDDDDDDPESDELELELELDRACWIFLRLRATAAK